MKEEQDKQYRSKQHYVGVALGVALDNIAVGIAVGVGNGIVLGAAMSKRGSRDDDV